MSDYPAHADHRHSNSSLPTYEDVVGSFHQYRASRNPDRHADSEDNYNCDYQHYPHQHTSDRNDTFFEVYDQQNKILDSLSKSADRRDPSKSNSALATLEASQATESERKRTHMSQCNICLITSFIIIVVSILLVLTLVKW